MSKYVLARTSVYNVGYHLVWSTKYRRRILQGEIETTLKRLLHDIAREKGFIIKELEVMPDHVHVFASVHPKVAPGYIYKMLKGISARRLFLRHPEITHKLWNGQLWNPSTFVETVGHISADTVQRYIQDQKQA